MPTKKIYSKWVNQCTVGLLENEKDFGQLLMISGVNRNCVKSFRNLASCKADLIKANSIWTSRAFCFFT